MRFAAVLLLLCVSAGCAAPPPLPRTITVVLYDQPRTFSPLAPAWGPEQQVMSLIYQSLLTTDPRLRLVPQLAESVVVSPDATTFTFALRRGLKWSDGTPFTSADVLFTHRLLADPRSTSAAAGHYRGATFSAPDDHTFVLTTRSPSYGIVAQVGVLPVLPRHVLGDRPMDRVARDPFFAAPTTGLGPFRFVAHRTGHHVELAANPHFPTRPGVDRVFLKPLSSDLAAAQLVTGEADVAALTPHDRDAVRDKDKLRFAEARDGGFVRIGLNLTRAHFADERVRRALLHGIDRQAIVDHALPGVGVVRDSSFDPAISAGVPSYRYDPDLARRLLAEAGWDSSRTVELAWVAGANRDRDTAVLAVQSQLREVGVQVRLRRVDAGWTRESLRPLDFDMYLFGGGNYAVEPWTVRAILGCDAMYPAGGNLVRFCDPALDRLMSLADASADPATRHAHYAEAARLDHRAVPYLWLYSHTGLWATNRRVRGFEPTYPAGGPFWHAENWAVD